MKKLGLALTALIVLGCGSYKPHDERIHLREQIRSDTFESNIVTRPIAHAFSDLAGEGLGVTNATTRRNEAGLLELQVEGYNKSYRTKRFRYRVEWLDENNFVIDTKTSVWLPMSAMGRSPFNIKAVAPKPEAVNFKMDTRKWE
jgi:uncharacterized protein YcfL